MKNVVVMTLDEITRELAAHNATPIGQRTQYDAMRIRELQSAERQILASTSRRWFR